MPRYTNYTNGSLVSYGRVMMSVLFIVLLIFLTSCEKAKKAVQDLLEVGPEPKPDLIVTIESIKTTLTAGETFELSFRVTNQGTAPAAVSLIPDRVQGIVYYPKVSTSSSISRTSPPALDGETGGQKRFGALGSLGPSETEDQSTDIQAPSTSGTYYYGVCVSPVEGETATSNNCSEGHRVTVSSSGGGSPGSGGSPGDGGSPGGGSPGGGESPGITFRVTDACNDGNSVSFRFFAVNNADDETGRWPGGNRVYTTLPYNQPSENHLACDSETFKICYGARFESGGRTYHFGSDIDNDRGCSDCCTQCPSSGQGRREVRFGCPTR